MDVYNLNGKEYQIIDILIIKDVKYAFFGLIDDPKKFCIRKIEEKDNKKYFVGLNSEEEFDLALKEFGEKYKDIVVLDN